MTWASPGGLHGGRHGGPGGRHLRGQLGQVLQAAGYKVWVYGQRVLVFGNPRLNGYWVADYAGKGPFMYDHRHVRATQYAEGQNYDTSTVRDSTCSSAWWVCGQLVGLPGRRRRDQVGRRAGPRPAARSH